MKENENEKQGKEKREKKGDAAKQPGWIFGNGHSHTFGQPVALFGIGV